MAMTSAYKGNRNIWKLETRHFEVFGLEQAKSDCYLISGELSVNCHSKENEQGSSFLLHWKTCVLPEENPPFILLTILYTHV